jgi:succinate dehydrogenase / fumarate reductase cytochrome b subunit
MRILNQSLAYLLQACPHNEPQLQLTWLLHRLTGVGIFIFLGLHILHIWSAGFGPEFFNTVMAYVNHPAVRILHLFLFFSVLFHAVNGVRTIVVDVLPRSGRAERHSIQVATVLFLLIFIPSALLMLMDAYLP